MMRRASKSYKKNEIWKRGVRKILYLCSLNYILYADRKRERDTGTSTGL